MGKYTHKGVIVKYEHNSGVYRVIDILTDSDRNKLYSIEETKGILRFTWKNEILRSISEMCEFDLGDCIFAIDSHRSLNQHDHLYAPINNYFYNDYYKGVLLNWDKNKDKRLYDIVDQLENEERNELYSITESKAALSFVWKSKLPLRIAKLDGFDTKDGDWFIIYEHQDLSGHLLNGKEKATISFKPKKQPIELEIHRNVGHINKYDVCKRQRWKCNMCYAKLKYDKLSPYEGTPAYLDHIHPYSKRDSYPRGQELINEESNIQALCETCNLKKSNKIIH